MVYCTYDLWASLTEHPYKRFVFQTILLAAEFTYCWYVAGHGIVHRVDFPLFFQSQPVFGVRILPKKNIGASLTWQA